MNREYSKYKYNVSYFRVWLDKYGYMLYALIFPLYLVAFFIEESIINSGCDYYVTYLPIDDYIPFNEYFIIPYSLWYPMIVGMGVYLIIKDHTGFKRYMCYIGLSFFSALAVYFMFPNGQELRPTVFAENNMFVQFIKYLYSIDTNTNVCPSLHVVGAFAVSAAAFECRYLSGKTKIIIFILSFFMGISTVFVKQHSILDVFVGVPYSLIAYFLVYRLVPKLKYKLISSQTVDKSNLM